MAHHYAYRAPAPAAWSRPAPAPAPAPALAAQHGGLPFLRTLGRTAAAPGARDVPSGGRQWSDCVRRDTAAQTHVSPPRERDAQQREPARRAQHPHAHHSHAQQQQQQVDSLVPQDVDGAKCRFFILKSVGRSVIRNCFTSGVYSVQQTVAANLNRAYQKFPNRVILVFSAKKSHAFQAVARMTSFAQPEEGHNRRSRFSVEFISKYVGLPFKDVDHIMQRKNSQYSVTAAQDGQEIGGRAGRALTHQLCEAPEAQVHSGPKESVIPDLNQLVEHICSDEDVDELRSPRSPADSPSHASSRSPCLADGYRLDCSNPYAASIARLPLLIPSALPAGGRESLRAPAGPASPFLQWNSLLFSSVDICLNLNTCLAAARAGTSRLPAPAKVADDASAHAFSWRDRNRLQDAILDNARRVQ